MKNIKILKPHQNAGIWYAVGQVTEVSDLRAKDLIDASLAEEYVADAVPTKPRITTQTKPRQTALTKTNAAVEPVNPAGTVIEGQPGGAAEASLEQISDLQTGGDYTGDQQDSISATGDDTINNNQG